MRLVHLLLLSLLFGNLAYAGNPEGPVEKKSILFLNKQKPVGFAADRLAPDTGFYNRNYQLYQLEKKEHSGKVLTITGLVTLGAGSGLTFAAVGFANLASNATGPATGAIAGTIIGFILGPACVVASVPLITIGAIRWSEGSFEKRLYLQLNGSVSPNGMGMKMNF